MYSRAPPPADAARPPLFSKRPHCPDRFTGQGGMLTVAEVLVHNTDFGRRGRMAQHMQPEHARRAAQRGARGGVRDSSRAASQGRGAVPL